MPHLHIESFEPLAFPAEYDGVTFTYAAQNVLHEDEKLIAASCEGRAFFLLLKRSGDKLLLKADKVSRPSPLGAEPWRVRRKS